MDVEFKRNTVGGRVFGWLQRAVVSLGELLGQKAKYSLDTLVNGDFEHLLEGYRQMVQDAKMPCMIPAGYFAQLMNRVHTPHPSDEKGQALRARMGNKFPSKEDFRLASYGAEPLCTREVTMHREVTVPTLPTDTKTLFKQYRILFTGDSGYVVT